MSSIPRTDPRREELAAHLLQRRAAKGMTAEQAMAAVEDPLYFASLLVAVGQADASVGGAVRTTADTVRAALHCIGPGEGLKTVSSAFVMVHPDPSWGDDGVMVFADCAVLPDPNPEQLAEIAISAAATFRSIVGGEPKVALLSFSSKGSAVASVGGEGRSGQGRARTAQIPDSVLTASCSSTQR